jgi:hypothetical protein
METNNPEIQGVNQSYAIFLAATEADILLRAAKATIERSE